MTKYHPFKVPKLRLDLQDKNTSSKIRGGPWGSHGPGPQRGHWTRSTEVVEALCPQGNYSCFTLTSLKGKNEAFPLTTPQLNNVLSLFELSVGNNKQLNFERRGSVFSKVSPN